MVFSEVYNKIRSGILDENYEKYISPYWSKINDELVNKLSRREDIQGIFDYHFSKTGDLLKHMMEMPKIKGGDKIVELGGGFGKLAEIILAKKKVVKVDEDKDVEKEPAINYVLIDTPVMAAVQTIYFAGLELPSKPNIIPIGLPLEDLKCDIFISLWALSEVSEALQDLVIKSNFFGAKKVFIATQKPNKDHPQSGRLNNILVYDIIGFTNREIPFLPENYYFIREDIGDEADKQGKTARGSDEGDSGSGENTSKG